MNNKFVFCLLKLFMYISLVIFGFNANAGRSGNLLSAKVEKAHANGEQFISYNIFEVYIAPKHTDILQQEILFRLRALPVSKLLTDRPNAISFTITNEAGRVFKLEFLKSHPFSKNVNIGYFDGKERHKLEASVFGIYYNGVIAGVEQSFASLSITNDGEVSMLLGDSTGNYVLAN